MLPDGVVGPHDTRNLDIREEVPRKLRQQAPKTDTGGEGRTIRTSTSSGYNTQRASSLYEASEKQSHWRWRSLFVVVVVRNNKQWQEDHRDHRQHLREQFGHCAAVELLFWGSRWETQTSRWQLKNRDAAYISNIQDQFHWRRFSSRTTSFVLMSRKLDAKWIHIQSETPPLL